MDLALSARQPLQLRKPALIEPSIPTSCNPPDGTVDSSPSFTRRQLVEDTKALAPSWSLIFLLATTAGLVVMNIYYNQPILNTIASSLKVDSSSAARSDRSQELKPGRWLDGRESVASGLSSLLLLCGSPSKPFDALDDCQRICRRGIQSGLILSAMASRSLLYFFAPSGDPQ
jgi:hypothetical protein